MMWAIIRAGFAIEQHVGNEVRLYSLQVAQQLFVTDAAYASMTLMKCLRRFPCLEARQVPIMR